jgi:hypothetical protein
MSFINTYFLTGFLLIATLFLGACAEIPIAKLTPQSSAQLKGKTFVVISREFEYVAQKPGLAMASGAPEWIFDEHENFGGEIMRRYGIEEPQQRIVKAISNHLERKLGMKALEKESIDVNTFYKWDVSTEEYTRLVQHYLNKVDYVVDAWALVKSENTFNPSRFATAIYSRLTIMNDAGNIDSATINDKCFAGINQANIPMFPDSNDTPYSFKNTKPNYKEMLENNAALLKVIFTDITDRCIGHYTKSTL